MVEAKASNGRHEIEIKRFNIPTGQQLSRQEGKLLTVLEDAVEEFGRVYSLQIDDRFPGANVYPHNATRERVLAEAAQDPRILDPYTKIEEREGRYIAVPYHMVYAAQVKPVVELLREAARMAPIEQALYFTSSARALSLGLYEEAIAAWLAMDSEPNIDAKISYDDRYDDKLFGRKYFAWASVGKLMPRETDRAQVVVEDILNIWEKSESRPSKMQRPKIKPRVDFTTRISGLAARYELTADSLPCQRDLRERYGNKFLVFFPPFEDRLIYERIPLMEKLVDMERFGDVTQEQVTDRALELFFAHETWHPVIRRLGDEDRLVGSYPMFSETYCYAAALLSLYQREGVTNQDMNLYLSLDLASGVSDVLGMRRGIRREHGMGHAIVLNYLLETSALSITRAGLARWERLTSVFQSLEGLIKSLEEIGNSGTESDFKKEMIDPLGSTRPLHRLAPLRIV